MKQDINANNLILITGGLFIPDRIPEIPEEIKKVLTLKKNKFDFIISTGSSCDKNTTDWLKSLLQNPNSLTNFIDVKFGDLTDINTQNLKTNLKDIETIKIGDFGISILNGYQVVPWGDIESLSSVQKLTGCDILVTGFTHKSSILNYDGKYFINPGSITGAYSPLVNDPSPSFMVLVISGDCGVVYLYELNTSTKNFDVSKYDINKIKSEQNLS